MADLVSDSEENLTNHASCSHGDAGSSSVCDAMLSMPMAMPRARSTPMTMPREPCSNALNNADDEDPFDRLCDEPDDLQECAFASPQQSPTSQGKARPPLDYASLSSAVSFTSNSLVRHIDGLSFVRAQHSYYDKKTKLITTDHETSSIDRIDLDPDPDPDQMGRNANDETTIDRIDLDPGPQQNMNENKNERAAVPLLIVIKNAATLLDSRAERFASDAANSKYVARHGIPVKTSDSIINKLLTNI